MAPQQPYPPPQSYPPPQYYPPPPPPYTGDWDGSQSMKGRQPQQQTTTTTSTATPTVSPFQAVTASSPPPHHSDAPYTYGDDDHYQHHSLPSGVMAAAGAIATIIFVLFFIILCCFLCKRSRKSKSHPATAEMGQVTGREMAKPTVPPNATEAQPYIKSPAGDPPSSAQASSSPTSLSQRPVPETAPVILSTTMDHSYFTGIDTSDHLSLADNRSMQSTDTEEPPPPYRPRSVPPISRESSVHVANGMLPNYRPGATLPATEESAHNPFDDPEDEVSDLEGESGNNQMNDDHLSMVSDLSYQQEPRTTYSTL